MPLVKLITLKRISELRGFPGPKRVFRFTLSILLTALCLPAFSQDNSPYTRFGLGDLVPSTNIVGRGMGGISAGNTDIYGSSINFSNPATYSVFQTSIEQASKKMTSGRVLLDMGINVESRTLKEPHKIGKFTANNFLFSHAMVGVPLRPNWGLTFGLRPISRISYKVIKHERLVDPNTGQSIDTALTSNEGDGGANFASIGTGFRFKLSKTQSLSVGVEGGYLFGKKEISVRRSIFNDSLAYNSGNFQTKTTYGNLQARFGLQYQNVIKEKYFLSFGVYGNMKRSLNASQDIVRETYTFDESTGNVRLDSVSDRRNIKGTIMYPSSYTAGFTLEKVPGVKESGWLIGVDFTQDNWKDYRFYGQADTAVGNKWEIRVGAQLRPVARQASYLSNVAYRAGFFIGRDYINVQNKLPLFGATFGMGLPLRNYNQAARYQQTVINLALEFIKRGNNDNLLKENLFRLSVGFSLSDFWFIRKKYE